MAFFLFRCSALDAAARWSRLAQRALGHFTALSTEQDSRVFHSRRHPPLPRSSLIFGEAGVWCVEALVAHARGEDAPSGLYRFEEIADGDTGDVLDAVAGTGSLLVGAAALQHEVGAPLAARLASVTREYLERRVDPFDGWLGAAHGWCGIAHALLRWAQAAGTDPDPVVGALLVELESRRLGSGLWPRRAGSDEVWPGWCHGSAGWVQLWTLAAEVLGDERFVELALAPGKDMLAATGAEGAGLCCGFGGEAYAATALYRATRDQAWLDAARDRAARAARAPVGDDFPEHSLWRGDLGAALICADLEQPERAGMPFYRAAG